MKKAILTGIVLVLMLFLLPSCAVEVTWEEYNRVVSDLTTAQTQIQSLQDDLTEAKAQIQSLQSDLTNAQSQIKSLQRDKESAEKKPAQALAYAEYLDVLLYPTWREAGLAPRFAFERDIAWLTELKSRASDMEDSELGNYAEQIERRHPTAAERAWYYCLDKIEKALK